MKEQGKRQLQFASVLRNALAQTIQSVVPQNLNSPNTLFSIGKVTVSADLKNAKIEVMCAEESMEENLKKLKFFAPIIRRKSAPLLHTKYLPNIRFIPSTGDLPDFLFKKNLTL
jgi:ribosome-binding factor A